MAAMDPNKNYRGKSDRAERREQAQREDRSEQVKAVSRSRRGI
jgi:hypothetical protein